MMTELTVILSTVGVLWSFIAISEYQKARRIAAMNDDDVDEEGNAIRWQRNRL